MQVGTLRRARRKGEAGAVILGIGWVGERIAGSRPGLMAMLWWVEETLELGEAGLKQRRRRMKDRYIHLGKQRKRGKSRALGQLRHSVGRRSPLTEWNPKATFMSDITTLKRP